MEDFLTNMYIYNVRVFMATATPYIIGPVDGVDINKLPKDITDYVYQSRIKFGHILDGNTSVSHVTPAPAIHPTQPVNPTHPMQPVNPIQPALPIHPIQLPTLNKVKENLHKKIVVDNITSHVDNGYIVPGPKPTGPMILDKGYDWTNSNFDSLIGS